MPRIALGGLLHVTNTFAPSKARFEDFARRPLSASAKKKRYLSKGTV